MVAFRFEASRSGDCVRRHLHGYRGILQVDGYAAYNKLLRKGGGNDGPRLAGCWAHSRRRFYELHAAGDSQVAPTTGGGKAALWERGAGNPGEGPQTPAGAPPGGSGPHGAPQCSLLSKTCLFYHSGASAPADKGENCGWPGI